MQKGGSRMKNVVHDLFTDYIRGIDRDPLPAEGSIDLPYPISLTKTVEEKTGNVVQKVNDQGEPLYKDNMTIDELTGEETFDEVTTPIKVTTYETVTNTYRVVVGETPEEQINEAGEPVTVMVPVYEEIHPESQVPIEWIDLEPVTVEEVVSRTYTLEQNPFVFTKDEVIEAKNKSIEDNANLPPTEVELLREDVTMTQGAIDFIIVNL